VSEPSAFEDEMAIKQLKRHKSPGTDQIPAELTKARVRYDKHKLIYSTWNKEELPEEWKESVILPIYKKGDKTDCITDRSTSLASTKYNILPKILMSSLTSYAKEIIGDHQCGFR
jgi:hypothetical protein